MYLYSDMADEKKQSNYQNMCRKITQIIDKHMIKYEHNQQ